MMEIPPASRAFAQHFGCPPELARFTAEAPLSTERGFFRFGSSAICFGRARAGVARPAPDDPLATLEAERLADGGWRLPFDPTDVAECLRGEAYAGSGSGPGGSSLARRSYYRLRPWLPVALRRHAQRFWLRDWRSLTFPRWPIDSSVDEMMEEMMELLLADGSASSIPFVWFWPRGFRACLILTHDVETAAGRDYCDRLMDLDEACGFKASFEIVPERRYAVTERLLEGIRGRGFEINVHGLFHDGRLFDERGEFLRRVEKINRYARDWGARGFRSPAGYRRLEWFGDLEAFDYDMSVPNVGRLEAQRGGCCTLFPYFLGRLVELPLTTTQDYSLIHILNDRSIDLWRAQTAAIVERAGLVSFVIHPDYVRDDPGRGLYASLLDHLRELSDCSRVWVALPRDVAAWWRRRAGLRAVSRDGGWAVEGEGAEEARVGRAELVNGRLAYRLDPPASAGCSGSR